jgi:uncharacterized paraquat-inducible protein A
MWNAQVYTLAIIVIAFSGIWPYVKIILMLICWFLKPKYLPVKHRARILEAMDSIGKWSFFDGFFIVIMVVAYRLFFIQFFFLQYFLDSKNQS